MSETTETTEVRSDDLGGTRYALRRMGIGLVLAGAFFFVTRVFAGWLGCPGQYVTGVPCDVGATAFAPPGSALPGGR